MSLIITQAMDNNYTLQYTAIRFASAIARTASASQKPGHNGSCSARRNVQ